MLEVRSLSCRRGARLVFRDAGFQLNSGSLLHVSGANGSGKSSLLRVLAGLLPNAGGAIHWNGQEITKAPAEHRERLHYVGHLDAVKPEFTGDEMLAYWRALRPSKTPSFPDPFGLGAILSKPVRTLSAGQKRRLSLSKLMLAEAPLWLLDEPTTALDQAGQNMLWKAVAKHRSVGGMAIIAAHHELGAPNVQTYAMPDVK